MPKYQTLGAAAFDLYVRNDEKIASGEFKLIPSNIALSVPRGNFLLVNSRSSSFNKFGLLIIPGIVDYDFCGNNDEIKIQALNLSKKAIILEKGTRIAQGIFVKISKANFVEVPKMSIKSRGGFGTTGEK